MMDLKEALQFNDYEIVQQSGILAKEFSLSSPRLDLDLDVGDQLEVNILGVDETVNIVGVQQQATDAGWSTEIKGFGTGYGLLSKSPKKTRSYISMTEAEYDEFVWDFGSDLGKTADYLEYVPLIKATADDWGTGGWSAISIMEDIVSILGLSLETNIIDYDVRQFSVRAGSPYIGSIIDLVKLYEPIVYEIDGILFVLEGLGMEASAVGGVLDPDASARVVSQEVVNVKSPDQLTVNGVLGQFIPDKYRGYAGNSEASGDSAGRAERVSFSFYGASRKESGFMESPFGGISYERRTARDIHGNDYFQYYEMRHVLESRWFEEGDYIEDMGRQGSSGYAAVYTRMDEQFDHHANVHWMFAHPVEISQTKITSGMVWRPPESSDPDPPLYMWEWKIAEEEITYGYSGSGRQDALTTQKHKLFLTDYEEFLKPYESLTREDSEDYLLGEDAWEYWGLYEWSRRIQVSLSRETYALVTIGQRLSGKGLKTDEATGDVYLDYEPISPSIEIVQAGGHQGNSDELRKMSTYSGEGLPVVGDPDEKDIVLDSHSESSSVNCCNWEHLDQIKEMIVAYGKKKKVTRRYQLPIQTPVTIGLPVYFNDIEVAPGQTISAPNVDVGLIASYHISKTSQAPDVNLEILAQGTVKDTE